MAPIARQRSQGKGFSSSRSTPTPRPRSPLRGAVRSPASTARQSSRPPTAARIRVFAIAAAGAGGLSAFRGDTGELLASPRDRVPGTKDFETLIAADGRLFVAADGKLYAFAF